MHRVRGGERRAGRGRQGGTGRGERDSEADMWKEAEELILEFFSSEVQFRRVLAANP